MESMEGGLQRDSEAPWPVDNSSLRDRERIHEGLQWVCLRHRQVLMLVIATRHRSRRVIAYVRPSRRKV